MDVCYRLENGLEHSAPNRDRYRGDLIYSARDLRLIWREALTTLRKEMSATRKRPSISTERHVERGVQSARAIAALALGSFALGAFAVGAIAFGAVAIGRLAIGRAKIRRLEIDELIVRKNTQD